MHVEDKRARAPVHARKIEITVKKLESDRKVTNKNGL
jgi:hypothetical protein